MVRVYVAALTGFLALSASASATLQLTSVNESLADAYDSTAPARGKLRAYAATNVESDERAFSNLLEHLKTLNVLFSPLSKERMEAAISKSDSSVVKHLSEDGAVNEKKLGIGRDGVKAFEPAKVSKVKMILEDIFRKPYNKILLKVLSKANGGERNLVRNLAQAEMLGFKVFFLKSTLASK
ncbi:hypothetical protein CCR75_006965 [Bremia lactucae]|uniref:RxLR effector protein n=1 Tax=Bremia lactucae TaxID=4779 RepID=A0A976FMC8_BRELC|nr:hypothetical protein CCR75_006965 [Bremia lactucae]